MRPAVASVLAGLLLWLAAGVGPARAQARAGVAEVIAEVRVHGNYATPDADVLGLAGVMVGGPFAPSAMAEVRERLKRSGRFDQVEIRKRYRSIDDPSQVVLIIIVTEFPTTEIAPGPPNPIQRIARSGMFLPILGYADGYGFTYGARATLVDAPADGGRVTFPLTWGGTKRAAAEFRQPIARGPIDSVLGGVAISRRRNPHYRTDDDRREVWVGAAQTIKGLFQVEGRAGYTRVGFDQLEDRFVSLGARVLVDTRLDPVFPRNAVVASAGWEHLRWDGGPRVNRLQGEVRGYVGLIGQTVLSLRAEAGRADKPLPPYERFLLGGAGSLRGYRAGAYSGDNLLAASAELRIPFTSPLKVGRAGVNVFVDAGTAYDHGTRLKDSKMRYGGGVGVFLLATIFQVNIDVAARQGGGSRVHVTTGFQF